MNTEYPIRTVVQPPRAYSMARGSLFSPAYFCIKYLIGLTTNINVQYDAAVPGTVLH